MLNQNLRHLLPSFQFPFNEPPQDQVREPSHRKENLKRNPLSVNPTFVQPSTKILDLEDQDNRRQDKPTADKLPGLTTQGTDFTTAIPTNREESNNDQGQRFSDGPEDKRYVDDDTGSRRGGTGGGSDGLPDRHRLYTNMNTKATTQRIRPEWFRTPRYPSPLRRWIPYTQSTAMPRRVTPYVGGLGGVVPTVASNADTERVTIRKHLPAESTSGSNTDGYDVFINRDDVRTGLETNERNGYVSDGNLTDGNQGNVNKPEARAWTGPVPHNLLTKQTTGPYILNTKLTTARMRHHSPMPPDTFSTMSPNATKPPENKITKALPPLAPLTKLPKVLTTTRGSIETIYNPYTPRVDGSYHRDHNGNHGDGYHHDGDMEQYYRDYHGDQEMPENTSNYGYRRPEEKQAPTHQIYGTGGYDY